MDNVVLYVRILGRRVIYPGAGNIIWMTRDPASTSISKGWGVIPQGLLVRRDTMTKKKKPWDHDEFWNWIWDHLMDHKQKEVIEYYLDSATDKEMSGWYESYKDFLEYDLEEYTYDDFPTREATRRVIRAFSDGHMGPANYPRRYVVKVLLEKFPKLKKWKHL